MFTAISIKNFRCFEEFLIEPTDRVNLIAGANNVGKTALLEAVFLLLGTGNIGLVVKISAFRGVDEIKGDLASIRELLWNPLFFSFDNKRTIQIRGVSDNETEHGIEIQLVPGTSVRLFPGDTSTPEAGDISGNAEPTMQLRYIKPSGETHRVNMVIDQSGIRGEPISLEPAVPGFFLAARHRTTHQEDAERFGKLDVTTDPDKAYNLLKALKTVEPRLKRLATIVSGGIPMIHGDIGLARMIPLSLMGDGLGRLTSLLLTIANASNGVVLIDEIENGLHHSILCKIWQAVHEAAHRFNTQVFATTHSFECVRAAHQAFEASEDYDFRLHRLDRVDDKIRATTYDQEALAAAIKADMEVR